jgi:hypothetical protein
VFSFEDLGFEETDEDFFWVYFRDIELGELDVAELRFRSGAGYAMSSRASEEHRRTSP